MSLREKEECDETFLAFARIYSGTLKKGSKLFAIGPKYDPRNPEGTFGHITEVTIDGLFVLMGRNLEEIDEISGNKYINIINNKYIGSFLRGLGLLRVKNTS